MTTYEYRVQITDTTGRTHFVSVFNTDHRSVKAQARKAAKARGIAVERIDSAYLA